MSDSALKPADEFDAVRMVVEILKGLGSEEQARVIRWAQEKLGIASTPAHLPAATGATAAASAPTIQGGDIRSFITTKNPSSDVQFAAAVAYFHAFVAPTKKAEIAAADLQEATRLANRERLHQPLNTLHNALKRGYLDKGTEKGSFRINTVGENLVAMSLPTTTSSINAPRSRAAVRTAARKK